MHNNFLRMLVIPKGNSVKNVKNKKQKTTKTHTHLCISVTAEYREGGIHFPTLSPQGEDLLCNGLFKTRQQILRLIFETQRGDGDKLWNWPWSCEATISRDKQWGALLATKTSQELLGLILMCWLVMVGNKVCCMCTASFVNRCTFADLQTWYPNSPHVSYK